MLIFGEVGFGSSVLSEVWGWTYCFYGRSGFFSEFTNLHWARKCFWGKDKRNALVDVKVK